MIEIPEACTLPTTELPLRLTEFAELFVAAEVERADATHVRLRLSGPAGLGDRVRELTAREAQCCSFFTFTTTAGPQPAGDGEAVLLDLDVPAEHADVLASLVALARP